MQTSRIALKSRSAVRPAFFLIYLAVWLFVPPAWAQPPCCKIVRIDPDSGWVTGAVTSSRRAFVFKPRDPAVLAAMSEGQVIHADFQTRLVSLDGHEVIGDIVGTALPPSSVSFDPVIKHTGVPPPAGHMDEAAGTLPCGAAQIPNLAGSMAPSSTTPLAPLAAVNELQRITWTNFARQTECDIVAQLMAMDGKDLAPPTDSEFAGIHATFATSFTGMHASVDFGSAPGIRYACLTVPDCPADIKPGFAVEAPIDGTGWSVHVGGVLHMDAQVFQQLEAFGTSNRLATYLSCCKPKEIDLTLSNIKIATAADFNTPVDLSRPILNGACVTVRVTLNLQGGIDTGGPKDLTLTANVPASGQISFTNAHPISVNVNLLDFGGAEVPISLDDLTITMAFDSVEGMTVKLDGTVKVSAFHLGAEDWGPIFGIHKKLKVSLPGGLLQTLTTGLPRTWGENPPERFWTQAANPALDFAAQASLIEKAIVPHLPWGAVLSIDHSHTGPVATHASFTHPVLVPPITDVAVPLTDRLFDYHCPVVTSMMPPPGGLPPRLIEAPKCYRQEFDSAIHTGEYLTAEAFRYAATHSDDALKRIKESLDGNGNGNGIARLFWVTEDAAVSVQGRTVAVGDKPGLFSRTAFPSDSPIPLGDSRSGKLPGLGKCYFIRPEGGWDVQWGTNREHFAAFSDIPIAVRNFLANERIHGLPVPFGNVELKLQPVGRTWYGLGCGEGDENPLSRDQYVGIFMGLAYAHALVPDADVQNTTRDLITKALTFLIRNNWDVRVPPYRRIPVDSNFLRAWEVQLAFLRIGASVNPDTVMPNGVTLSKLYQTYAAGSKLSWIPTWFTMLEPMIGGGFASNLSHAAVGPALLLETDPELHQNFMLWYNMLRRGTQFHKNAYFNALSMLVGGLAPTQASSPSNPTLTLQEEFKGILAEWLQRRDALDVGNGLPYNFVGNSKYQQDVFNRSDAALYTTLAGDQRYVSKYALPVYARNGDGLDFVWQRNPFNMALKIPKPPPPPAPDLAAEYERLREFMKAHGYYSMPPMPPLPPVPPPEFDCTAPLPTACTVEANAATAEQVYHCGSDHANQEAPGVDYLLAYWMGVYLHILPPPV
jgi:hypothetical protein